MSRHFAVMAVLLATLASASARADTRIRCDDLSTADLSVDGMLDDWKQNAVLAHVGAPSDGAIALRCSWDGTALAIALDIHDDRVVRVRGRGDEDRVDVSIAAGGKPVTIVASPGNAVAGPKIHAPAHVRVADSLQPKGFSLELAIPASAIAGLSPSTPSLALRVTYHDADRAVGGAAQDLVIAGSIVLGDRKDLLDDFLRAVRLRRADVKLDTLAELDPDRRGKERLVAGGAVIGVLTDRFAYVTLPVARPADVRKIELLPLGRHGQQIVAATVRQTGNGGSRDLLVLWTVWSGQLQPLAQIEICKERDGNVLRSTWTVAKAHGKHPPELRVTPVPAVGWTADTWNEQPADDADAIVPPWDPDKDGIGYTLDGAELTRRDLPKPHARGKARRHGKARRSR